MKTKHLALIICLSLFSACSWYTAHKTQLAAIGGVALDHIAKDAYKIGLAALQSEAESGFTKDIGYELQTNARDSLATIISSESLQDYLNAWDNAATDQLAALVPPNLSPSDAQKLALVIVDSQAAAIPQAD